MEDKINISELICTRISHDLIGNIGAFANAVELLEDEDDDFIDEIKNTLKTSSEVLTARLKFFRMAFGLTNANLENIETVKKVTEDYLQTLNLNHPVKADIKIINSPFNRAVMLACMCAAEVIVRGGTVKVSSTRQAIIISAVSDSPLAQNKISAMQTVLEGGTPENISQYAPLYYLQKILNDEERKLTIDVLSGFLLSANRISLPDGQRNKLPDILPQVSRSAGVS